MGVFETTWKTGDVMGMWNIFLRLIVAGKERRSIGICAAAGLLFGVLFCVSAPAAETGELYLLAEGDTWEEDSLDDFDFFDEEEEAQETATIADPLRGWNEAVFVFNDKAYFWVIKPIGQGYAKVVPEPARKGLKNFFHNILMPVRFVNCILQGKGEAATGEFGRFMLNSTVGVLGFGDPAARYPHLNPDAEDFGQTLGRYGIGNGFYIVWPFLGSSTLRDSVGDVGDWFLEPVNYLDSRIARYSIKAGDKVNAISFRIGEYEAFKDAAIDPYTAYRDFYIDYRREKVRK
jgi:phospholipid-binding lipoprotein MlaA